MQQIHPYVSDVNRAYVDEVAKAADVTSSHAINMILTRARQLGWKITPGDEPRVTGDKS